EPGEHERIYCDFIIPATVTMVEIHTMVQCSADQNSQHWEDEVLVNIAEAAPAKVGGPNTPLLARGGQ
ncbi:MAG TPA: hypothetical protein VM939_12640, partial [Gemmatimonadaceae bacterium]|nr:hypothetical protein [Gemmatimonadaceae bacterium]